MSICIILCKEENFRITRFKSVGMKQKFSIQTYVMIKMMANILVMHLKKNRKNKKISLELSQNFSRLVGSKNLSNQKEKVIKN